MNKTSFIALFIFTALFAVKQDQTVYITPEAAAKVEGESDFFIMADLIYWTAKQDGLEYARNGIPNQTLDGTTLPPAFANIAAIGETKAIGSHWDPGFKVGIGLNLQHDGWDVSCVYTWFQSEHSDTGTNGAFAPLWNVGDFRNGTPNFTMRSLFNTVAASWKVNFNNVNFKLGRNFYISHFLKLHPYFGFRAAWQKQDFITDFADLANAPVTEATQRPTILKMNADQDHWGIGVLGGLAAAFQFNHNWSLFGSFDLSGLWGQYDIKRKDTATWVSGSTTTDQTYFWGQNKYHTVVPVCDLNLGFRFDHWFDKDNHHFSISAGWEELVWFNMNQFIEIFTPDGNNGNLSFQGFTLEFRFDF
jgi:hypothetical protein